MFTPDPHPDAITAHARPRRRGPSRKLGMALMAGSASVALGASVCSALLVPAQSLASAPADPSASPTPTPTPTFPTIGEEARRKCRPRALFRFHDFRARNFFIPRTRFIDGPGGTMTVSVRRQHRVYLELEIEREKQSEVGHTFTHDELQRSLLRRLRNNVNPLLAEEHIVEAGHDYAQVVSPGMYGNLWYRVFGYRVGWAAWQQLQDCSVNRVATGIANVPARVEGWRYWETKHPMFRGHRLSEK
ncbi:hypothetical protein [Streptosporangium sp. NPDC051022]|uniref:hypothetical protein n=1 Tax=Streptosporangium sp. NPDC051022 TaxID=3155752 RepID=UPI00343239E8